MAASQVVTRSWTQEEKDNFLDYSTSHLLDGFSQMRQLTRQFIHEKDMENKRLVAMLESLRDTTQGVVEYTSCQMGCCQVKVVTYLKKPAMCDFHAGDTVLDRQGQIKETLTKTTTTKRPKKRQKRQIAE